MRQDSSNVYTRCLTLLIILLRLHAFNGTVFCDSIFGLVLLGISALVLSYTAYILTWYKVDSFEQSLLKSALLEKRVHGLLIRIMFQIPNATTSLLQALQMHLAVHSHHKK